MRYVFLTIAFLLAIVCPVQAWVGQRDLPYLYHRISATGAWDSNFGGWPYVSFIDGHYAIYTWYGDGVDNSITGTVTGLDLTQDNAWLEVGFGWVNTSGGYLIFGRDLSGIYAHLQYAVGRRDSDVVRLDNSGNYGFSLTAKDDGSFVGTVTDSAGAHSLTGRVSDTLPSYPRVFAMGLTDGASAVARGHVTLSVVTPGVPAPSLFAATLHLDGTGNANDPQGTFAGYVSGMGYSVQGQTGTVPLDYGPSGYFKAWANWKQTVPGSRSYSVVDLYVAYDWTRGSGSPQYYLLLQALGMTGTDVFGSTWPDGNFQYSSSVQGGTRESNWFAKGENETLHDGQVHSHTNMEGMPQTYPPDGTAAQAAPQYEYGRPYTKRAQDAFGTLWNGLCAHGVADVDGRTWVTQYPGIGCSRDVTVVWDDGGSGEIKRLLQAASATGDTLTINVINTLSGALYVQPGKTLVANLDVSDLRQKVKACQAILGYSSTYLTAAAGCVVPGSPPWNELIYNSWDVGAGVPGEIDTAVGVYVESNPAEGTDADGTVAKITLTAGSTEGITQLVFRPDVDPGGPMVECTFLSDMNANPVWPTKVDSQPIVIDGTKPTISVVSAKQGGVELIGGPNAVQGVVNIQVTASDALAGLDGHPVVTVTPNGGSPETATFVNESPTGTFNYTWQVTASTPNGTATINASVSDKAGNTAEATPKTFNVNKNQITGTVSFGTLSDASYSCSRVVTFVATDGSGTVLATWTPTLSFVNSFGTASAGYTLTDVPDGTTGLSAKTAWSLRNKLSVSLGGNGQAENVNFTGTEKLLGGDLNESNSINILDYTKLKVKWYKTGEEGAPSDINGDGTVNTADYDIMKSNWFKVGDPE